MSSYLFSIGGQILVYALRVVGKVTKAIDRKIYDRSSLSTDASAPVAALVNSLSRDYVLQMPFFLIHVYLPLPYGIRIRCSASAETQDSIY